MMDRTMQAEEVLYTFRPFEFRTVYNTTRNFEIEPIPRSGHRITCHRNCLYSFGGFNPGTGEEQIDQENFSPLLCELWQYHFTANSWEKLNCVNIPREVASIALVECGYLQIIVYGGTGVPFGAQRSNTLTLADVRNLSKNGIVNFNKIEASGTLPDEMYGQATTVEDGRYLYAVGGTNGFEYSIDIHKFDLHSKTWEMLYKTQGGVHEPRGRYRHEIILYKRHIFVFGGGTAANAEKFTRIWTFDLDRNQWKKCRTIGDSSTGAELRPSKRKCHGCVQNPLKKSQVFITGGIGVEHSYNDTWMLNLDTMHFTQMSTMNLPYELYFHGTSATPDGRLVVYGGISTRETPRRRTSDICSAWMGIPKLEDMCWEAIDFYIKNGIFSKRVYEFLKFLDSYRL